jgi:prepilin signal peptidase PulO-like enzyme (type II secretory pathway)
MIIITIFLFILGAGVGSFIDLYSTIGGKATRKRSRCDKCHHKLVWSDVVPILSYVLLRGKCRYCKEKISPRHIFVEVLVGCLFALSYLQLPFSVGELVVWLGVLSLLVSLFLTDLYYQKVSPVQIVILAIFCSIFTVLTEMVAEQKTYSFTIIEHFFSLIPLTGLFGLTYLISRGKFIGLGDVLLGVPIAILLSWRQALAVLLLASALAVLCYLPMMIKQKIKPNTKIPFGAFLVLATLAVFFTG